ncbi:FtsW/RodA/SpoVE family cell cycle protein [Virgibacillus sp. 179-BFC.A HS]|uniref:FtsW/RodA/SpoVE family cell cycle protein n=1 Tax=Tigheibacillus jepli TaxID=3035914 RepID=A0ABU5CJQ0_9BACI|nr:FtsW/RodA/SpoVE family cell cycle protein [Virgibacillus sp. 179-BFC.A HS]MDY0406460.1 FtsW/RodA/SpoVE family cell cycle protein [Virgibacillus sp. 179-BFC.A HS]
MKSTFLQDGSCGYKSYRYMETNDAYVQKNRDMLQYHYVFWVIVVSKLIRGIGEKCMSNKQSHYLQLDFIVLFILFAGVSLLAIYNAQQLEQYGGKNFVVLQIFWFVAGISIVAFLQLFDLEQLYKVSIFAYLFGVLLLAVLLVSPESIARTINNAKSWFTLPGFSMQPSEFAKISTILYTSVSSVNIK